MSPRDPSGQSSRDWHRRRRRGQVENCLAPPDRSRWIAVACPDLHRFTAIDPGLTDLKLICDEVGENGDNGYDTGTYSVKVPIKEGKMAAGGTPTEVTGKYVVVWMKEDGAWKLHRDIWNDDPAK